MKEHLSLLGFTVRDVVTGISGVCDSVCFDLYGCVQASIKPQVDPAKPWELPISFWFDTKRLTKISDHPVMETPTFEVVPGPAEKASRGSDMAQRPR